MTSDFEIVEKTSIKSGQPKILTGFAGAGFIGSTALMYIARQKELELKAEVRSRYIPPSILLIDGEPTFPFRIYGDKEGEMLIVVSEALVPPENCYFVGNGLMDWLQKKKASDFVFVEGMPIPTVQDSNIVYGFSFPNRDLYRYGIKPLREGGVSGLNAVLLDHCLKKKIPATTLITPTVMVSGIDFNASATAIDVLSKMFKLGIDTTPLKKSIEMQKKLQERSREQMMSPTAKHEKKSFFDAFRKKD